MLLAPDRKKAATLIVGRMDNADDESLTEESEDEFSMALEDAAERVMDALERKDVKGFVSHMKDLFYMYSEEEDEEEEELPPL